MIGRKRFLLCATAFFLLLATASAETFRVHALKTLRLLPDSAEEQTVSIGINDSIAVFMPEDKTYIEGIELKVQIPKIVADWRDSVAFSVYDSISPRPATDKIDYSGRKIYVTPLPTKLTWIVHIPLSTDTSLKPDSYITKLNVTPDVSAGYTFLRFQPAMKGVPDETYESELTVSAKPILKNIGKLELSVLSPENQPASGDVFIDGTQISLRNGSAYLTPGLHTLNVQVADYRNEARSIVIEQAKTTNVTVALRSTEPTLTVNAPANAEVFLDDKPFKDTGTEIRTTEGEHKIRFLIGGYEVIRTLTIQKGKSYSANLTVDLEITEE